MKTLILTVACVFSAVPSQAANVQIELQKQLQQLEVPNEQVGHAEEYASKCRAAIEDYYTDRLTELRLRTDAAIRLLEVAEQPKPHWAGFAEWAQFAETVLQINGYEQEPYGLFEATDETPAKRLAAALSRIAERKSDILAQFEWEAAKLERQKGHALTTGLAGPEPQTQKAAPEPKPKATHGLVTGILYSRQDPSALIDGKIVRETGTIHGVKIVKIDRDKVEFDKDGRTWSQGVQETPNDYWK